MVRLLITLLVGSVGGLLGYNLRVPAGALIGSMLAVGIYNCLGFQAFMPPKIRIAAQIVVGCLLGLRLDQNAFIQLRTVYVPALIIIVSLLIGGLITGFIVYKLCKVEMHTAFLSSSPGGMTELSLLAVSLGGDGPKVTILQTIRMIAVVAVMPVILPLLEKLL